MKCDQNLENARLSRSKYLLSSDNLFDYDCISNINNYNENNDHKGQIFNTQSDMTYKDKQDSFPSEKSQN